MAELTVTNYNRFRDGINTQYNAVLEKKKKDLQEIEENNQKQYEKICYKWAEHDMFCELYGVTSPKAENISDEIEKLINEYDKEDYHTKIDELKKEIEWLEGKIQV